MPPTTRLFEVGSRNSFVCRSCLNLLQKPQVRHIRTRRAAAPVRRKAILPQNETQVAGLEPAKSSKDAPYTLRFFEQDRSGRIKQLRGSDEFDASVNAEEEAGSTLSALERKLEEVIEMIKGVEDMGLGDEAEEMKKKLGIERASSSDLEHDEEPFDDEDEDDIEPKRFEVPPIDMSALSRSQSKPVRYLENHLPMAMSRHHKGTLNETVISTTWKLYSKARTLLAKMGSSVPREVWRGIWDVLSVDSKNNPERMPRIYMLSRDMDAAGVALDGSQQILAIEAMFIRGMQKEAIANWKRTAGTWGVDPQTVTQYWELGIRMLSFAGEVERAERASQKLFSLSRDADPRVLLPLIRATLARGGSHDRAWEHYRQMREWLGSRMVIADYDEVIACFLSSNQTEYGLFAFVDMMFSGAIDMQSSKGKKLPLAIRNGFFWGKWLKRLIGAGDLDGAINVLKLMQTKRVMASTIQVNGLVGSLLRSGTADDQQKAEDIAWAMIRSRQAYVDLRKRNAQLEWPIQLYEPQAGHDEAINQPPSTSSHGLTFLPRASLETFCILAENYRARNLHSRIEELWVAQKEAEIATDNFMLDQLLESYHQEGRNKELREIYDAMTQEHDIVPSSQTFLTLFKSLSVNNVSQFSVTDEMRYTDSRLCRQYFGEMVQFSWIFDEQGIHNSLARFVLHAFRATGDYVGLIVALRILRDEFQFSPTDVITFELIAERNDLYRKTDGMKRRIMATAQNIEAIMHRRAQARRDAGEEVTELSEEGKADEFVGVIEDHYRKKIAGTKQQFKELYDATVEDLGMADGMRHPQDRKRRIQKKAAGEKQPKGGEQAAEAKQDDETIHPFFRVK